MENNKKVLKFNPKKWDWYAFLSSSEGVKYRFREEADELAGCWTTCACGQLCTVLPRSENNVPLDREANILGNDFYDAIEHKEWSEAKKVLDKIEERTIFLLQQPNYTDPKTL
jgi:hypothetical protein